MKIENINGRPIFSEKVWNQMCTIGNLLNNLGYSESIRKPNLFYKKINYENNKKDQQGFIFCALRGTEQFPIWEDPSPNLYFKDLTYGLFVKELIILKRNECPIKDFTRSNWFPFNTISNGYCRKCKIDLINSKDWENLILSQENIVPRIELHYCENCKKNEYINKKQRDIQRDLRENLRILCKLCGKIDKNIIKHHITYNSPETIKVCRSCHGIIHSCTFPHYLWKEKRQIEKEKVVQYCKFCKDFHIKDSGIANRHTIMQTILEKYQKVIKLSRKTMSNNIDLKQRRTYYELVLQTRKEIKSLRGELSFSDRKKVQKMMDKFIRLKKIKQ